MFLIAGYKVYDLVQDTKDKISFEFLRPKRGDVNLLEEKIRLRIRIRNQNPIGFPVNGVQGKITQDGVLFGEIQSTSIHDIPANGSVDLMTEINIISEDILFKIVDNIKNSKGLAPLDFNGTIFIKDRSFPVYRQIRLF